MTPRPIFWESKEKMMMICVLHLFSTLFVTWRDDEEVIMKVLCSPELNSVSGWIQTQDLMI